ncbi:MAG: hypothetical protein KDA93_18860 [Planctomycetaceae bacterium]|nr:hypothetical protein [Planctomycetaceae bacterium]
MNRIFATLAVVSNLGLIVTFLLGWAMKDPTVEGSTGVPMSVHFLVALAAVTLTLLVHAIVLTYFMGTGRWIEETSEVYQLGIDSRAANIKLKYQTMPGMVACILLLIVTGGFGAVADPGSSVTLASSGIIHLTLACVTLLANVAVSVVEYQTIQRNGRLVDEIMSSVRTIRRERGLDDTPVTAEA